MKNTAPEYGTFDRHVPSEKPLRPAWLDEGGQIRCVTGRCIDVSSRRIHGGVSPVDDLTHCKPTLTKPRHMTDKALCCRVSKRGVARLLPINSRETLVIDDVAGRIY